jgi:hypothetical protein
MYPSATRQERAPAHAAHAAPRVHVREPDALRSQRVQVRSLRRLRKVVRPQVAPTHVVRQKENDVWPRSR